MTFDNEIPGTFRCNRPVCNTCDFVSHVTVVTGAYNNFYIRRSFTCTSENVVYCIICSKCGHLYIGKTGRGLEIDLGNILVILEIKGLRDKM